MNSRENSNLAWLAIVTFSIMGMFYYKAFKLAKQLTSDTNFSISCNSAGECDDHPKVSPSSSAN